MMKHKAKAVVPDSKYPLWAEQAFIGATKMADTWAAYHILRALAAKWPTLVLLHDGYRWQQVNGKSIIAYTGEAV
jgi:hypothetical protein